MVALDQEVMGGSVPQEVMVDLDLVEVLEVLTAVLPLEQDHQEVVSEDKQILQLK